MNNANKQFQDVPVLILCGGKGIVVNEQQSERVNKGLIVVQGQPMFSWVMQHYAHFGAQQFVLATGFQSERFRQAMAQLPGVQEDGADGYRLPLAGHSCHVRLVDTGLDATTAGRMLACKAWLEQAPCFAMSYSDTLSDLDLGAELRFHRQQGLTATLTAAKYPLRFRILGMRQGERLVRAFAPRPVIETVSINGGYYLFGSAIWTDYGLDAGMALEEKPLERLAAAGQLAAYDHQGNWQHCDAERDLAELSRVAGLQAKL